MRLLELTGNCTDRAFSGTGCTADAPVRVNLVPDELLALAGRTLLVLDVCLILFREIAQR